MKQMRLIPLIAVAAMLSTSCMGYEEHVLKGTLYADSAHTIPAAGDTLTFRAGTRFDYDRYLGQAITDAQGRWAFQYIQNFANPHQNETETSSFYDEVLIKHGADTLYTGWPDRNDIILYPGCWESEDYGYTPDTTIRNGVNQ